MADDPDASGDALPGRAEMARLDRAAIEDLGLPLLAMMEHAGTHLAAVAREVGEGPVLVLAGKGNNGGGGLAAARHLANAGADVAALVAAPLRDLTDAAGRQARILTAMGVTRSVLADGADARAAIAEVQDGRPAGTLVDALLGYNAEGAPRPPLDALVDAVNAAGRDDAATVVSLDLPTGLDATTGGAPGPVVEADATATLAAVNRGLTVGEGPRVAGRVCLCDLGIPTAAYAKAGLSRPDFGAGSAGRRWM